MDIKKILKHIDGVEGKQKKHRQLNEAASMIINGDNADDVGIILDRIKGVTSPSAPAPQGNTMRGDMDKFISAMGPREPIDMDPQAPRGMGMGKLDIGMPSPMGGMDDMDHDDMGDDDMDGAMIMGGDDDDMDDEKTAEWANEPDEDYKDIDFMNNGIAGGINREKKAFLKAQPGDNAMAVESIKARLLRALAEANKKPDFRDFDNDGNKTEPMTTALADKKKKNKMKEAAKPAFLDPKKNRNKKEPMKKAAADVKKK